MIEETGSGPSRWRDDYPACPPPSRRGSNRCPRLEAGRRARRIGPETRTPTATATSKARPIATAQVGKLLPASAPAAAVNVSVAADVRASAPLVRVDRDVTAHLPLGLAVQRDINVGSLLAILLPQDDAGDTTTAGHV
jgi:hypothetical protein